MLLECLSDLGVQGIELLWFTNYLSQRVQHVKTRDKVSSWSLVKGGVPQGSALGPLLFLVYVNAMPSLVKYGRLLQFADDTTLICVGDNRAEVQWKLEHDLQLLLDWINSSRIKLNITKSNIMWFKPKHGIYSKKSINFSRYSWPCYILPIILATYKIMVKGGIIFKQNFEN